MPSKKNKTKVIIATLGLDTHWRGAVTVAMMLKDLGMEVIYLTNIYPNELIKTAIMEDVDIVGVSVLSGAHLTLGGEILNKAEEQGIKDNMLFIIGGVFPPHDIPKLKELGYAGVFGPGMTKKEIVDFIKNTLPSNTVK